MLAKGRPYRPSHAVVAYLSPFVALGGSSYAAIKVTGKNVKASSLTGKDVKNSSLDGGSSVTGAAPDCCFSTRADGGRLVFHVFGALAEFERELMRERMRAGLEAARPRAPRWSLRRRDALASAARASIPIFNRP